MTRIALVCLALLAAALGPARAETRTEVDVAIVLAVDVSRSMSPRELEIQRRGYAEAITAPDVVDAIGNGMIGQIALTYVEWAGVGSQRVIVPWTMIRGQDDARRFADQLVTRFDPALRRTSISSGLLFSAALFEISPYVGLREVIDVSGDGPNNQGEPVLNARQQVLDQGITINGLPLMTREGMGSDWHLEDLDLYYEDCVIGGPGAFVIPVLEWHHFPDAVRRKLILEIAGLTPAPPAPLAPIPVAETGYDCMIGEKIWQQRRGNWVLP